MPWVRIEDTFPEHPKLIGLSDAAFRLHIHALCYAARMLTDGRIPRGWLTGGKGRVLPKSVAALVGAGVWDIDGDNFQIHDYLEYQPSREDVAQQRSGLSQVRSEVGRKGAHNRWQKAGKPIAKGIANGWQPDSKGDGKPMAPSHPIPSTTPSASSSPLVKRRNLNAVFEHPRFDVPIPWHNRRVSALSDGEAGMSKFYEHLATHIEAHPQEDTEPRFEWLTAHFDAWVKARNHRSDVPSVEETRKRLGLH